MKLFDEFELPFVPTVVVGFGLLLGGMHIWSLPTHPVESLRQLEAMDAELVGNVVYVDSEPTNGQSTRMLSLADHVWKVRPEYDPGKPLEIAVRERGE